MTRAELFRYLSERSGPKRVASKLFRVHARMSEVRQAARQP